MLSPFKSSIYFANSNQAQVNSKKILYNEILKENTSFSILEKDRPFTPPLSKLVQMSTLNSLELSKREDLRNENKPEMIQITNDVNGNEKIDLIYDHILGCYYDPKSNNYYEMNN